MGTSPRRALLAVTLLLVAIVAIVVGPAGPSGAARAEEPPPDIGRHTYRGTIDGADYRIETPEHWNGTLLLYSHGYYPPFFPAPPNVGVTNSTEAETWFVDHGYALAASNYKGVLGFQIPQGTDDGLKVLDWFTDNVAAPKRVIATGQSQGATIATLQAERRPDLIDGTATVCGAFDPQNLWNAALDLSFAVKVLLAPGEDIDLVKARDPEGSTTALQQAVERARTTPEGRARIALAASLNNVSGWWSAFEPRPTDPDEVILRQANWLEFAYIGGYGGPGPRVELEAKVGGNPSSNVGVDYRRLLARSDQTQAVKAAYKRAGLDLRADLAALDAAPRVAADPAAEAFMLRTSVPTGRLRTPLLTLHSVGDGGAVPDSEPWYRQLVHRHGGHDLVRSIYVNRGQHCSTSGADEVTAVQSVGRRLDTGRWPDLRPATLNAQVAGFDPVYQQVNDLSTFPFGKQVMPPAFVRFRPPMLLRPSR